MTIETWESEFYPITSKQAAKGSALDATVHSLRKWDGKRSEALARHGVRTMWPQAVISDGNRTFCFNGATCALCVQFRPACSDSCGECPLYLARDKVSCDARMPGEDVAPYHDASPEPMIAWLGKALSECE
jgi:hypothetical protein